MLNIPPRLLGTPPKVLLRHVNIFQTSLNATQTLVHDPVPATSPVLRAAERRDRGPAGRVRSRFPIQKAKLALWQLGKYPEVEENIMRLRLSPTQSEVPRTAAW